MKKKNILILIILILSCTIINSSLIKAQKTIDLFNEIISKANIKVVEYGTTLSFKTTENGRKKCINLLRKLDYYDIDNINILENNKMYCIDFNKNNTSGYIESVAYDGYNVITINVIQKNSINELNKLKNKIKKVLNNEYSNNKFFDYLKGRIIDGDIYSANNKISNILKQNGATNIETVNISNGYSTIAYTKKYRAMKNDGKIIDFNYAVCRYSSGNYIIIGTPEIIVSY